MRRFYALLAATLLATVSFAQKPIRNANTDASIGKSARQTINLADGSTTLRGNYFKPTANAAASRIKKTDAEETLITEQPEGTLYKDMYYSSYYYLNFYNTVLHGDADGYARDMVVADDGSIYIKNPISQLSTGTWLKGTKGEGDTIVVKMPQPIYEEGYEGDMYKYYAAKFYYSTVERWYVEDTVDTDMKFVWRNDSLICTESTMLGLLDEYSGDWVGFGDLNLTMSKINETAPSIPSDATVEKYMLEAHDTDTTSTYAVVDVAIDGSDIYINGFPDNYIKNPCIKGTIEGNKVTFPAMQYVGVDSVEHAHVFAASANITVTETFGITFNDVSLNSNPVVFDYDSANKTLTTTGNILFNYGNKSANEITSFRLPELNGWNEVAAVPADPVFVEWLDYDASSGYGRFGVNLYAKDVNGNTIDPAKMYYNIYMDEEVLTLYPDEYIALSEEMTDIPFYFVDNYSIHRYNDKRRIYYYSTGFEKLGVKVYYTGGGETNASNLVYYYVNNEDTGISGISSDETTVKSVSYTDLSGRKVSNPSKGIFIKSTTYADGTKKNIKIIKK
ncbi:MAG: hypothetical protein Q4D41_09430 [Prevotellaceae bacterium]|nr:hypothetical protein [Prevotellaceae bacterium]